jgi:CRISPR-associated protein Cas1
MEELRHPVADRAVLTLINRKQIKPEEHFESRPGGAVLLNEDGRREFLKHWQARKQEEIEHPILGSRVPLGLVPHVQARLLARFLRGDADEYVPFLAR